MKVLKLDLDIKLPKEWLSKFIETRSVLLDYLKHPMLTYHIFETTRGMHLYITLQKEVDDETANMLQFLLGDDHTRVKINQWRIKRGIQRWNKLFHRVIYRKKAKVITCYYCGNKIPVRDKHGDR